MVADMQTSLPSTAEIWTWLDAVSDPEIPVLSVVDLGIVRSVRWVEAEPEADLTATPPSSPSSDSTLVVTITPTYSGCPATAVIKAEIIRAMQQRGVNRVRLETQLSPAWTTDWMSERGKMRLLEYGIAPPEAQGHGCTAPVGALKLGLAPVLHSFSDGGSEARTMGIPCPRCGSADTRLVSRFGSTPCKAFYICNSCLEPFDHFKCH
jgi:ring-1,2-phenylacetyl-CoA epoxidase subunit PaaD